jgi:hypothetical protein
MTRIGTGNRERGIEGLPLIHADERGLEQLPAMPKIAEIERTKTFETQRNRGSGGMTRIFETETMLHPAMRRQGESR